MSANDRLTACRFSPQKRRTENPCVPSSILGPATIFCALFSERHRRQTSKPLGKQEFAAVSRLPSHRPANPGVRSLRRLPCAPRPTVCGAHAHRFAVSGFRLRRGFGGQAGHHFFVATRRYSATYISFCARFFGAETPEKAGFFRSPASPRELREDDPLRNSPQNSPFREFRGHGNFEGEIK